MIWIEPKWNSPHLLCLSGWDEFEFGDDDYSYAMEQFISIILGYADPVKIE